MTLRRTTIVVASLAVAAAVVPAQASAHGGHGHGTTLKTVADGLNGPRGIDHLGHGKTLVTEADGSFSLIVERRHHDATKIPLGSVPAGFIAPAISAGPHHPVYILTGGGEPGTGAATLYRWRWGDDAPTPVFDVAAYQQGDPDPYDLEDFAEDSNPFGVVALRDGSVLVSDAAGNELIHVWPDSGHAVTVARIKPRVVPVPDFLPATDPDTGEPLPPHGTPIPREGVATSVTVGADGYWYVGELRGFPATPGTSQIWRIRPGSVDAVCDPEHPYQGSCRRYADGLTSIVDLGAAPKRGVYAVELSKMSWLAMELGLPDSEIGGLFQVSRQHQRELVPDQLVQPGGVDGNAPYVVGPVFGPGALSKVF
jgi:hypothetical protein